MITHTNYGRAVKKLYPKAVKVSDQQMEALALEEHENLPKWNYTLSPLENGK